MALPPPFSLPNLLLFWRRDAAEQIKAGDRVGWFPPMLYLPTSPVWL